MTTTAASNDLRRKRALVVWAAAVGWLTLAFFAITSTRAPIERDLTVRSEAALVAAGLGHTTVEFEGRDATLTGTVELQTQAESARAVVMSVDGVRVVSSELAVAVPPTTLPPSSAPSTSNPPSTGSAPASFVMLVSEGTVALTGTVPSEEMRDSIVAGAVEAFGVENVVSRLTVSPAVAMSDWLANLPYLLVEMGDVTEFSLVIAGGTAELSGLAVSETARSSIESLVRASLPGLEVVNQLEIGTDERDLVQGKLDELALSRITFAVGSTELQASGLSVLEEVVAILEAHSSVVVEVGGHTDASGLEDRNLELSQGRADAVVAYLISHGIEESRLTAVGYGSSEPIADNLTEAGRAANRRIEIIVVP